MEMETKGVPGDKRWYIGEFEAGESANSVIVTGQYKSKINDDESPKQVIITGQYESEIQDDGNLHSNIEGTILVKIASMTLDLFQNDLLGMVGVRFKAEINDDGNLHGTVVLILPDGNRIERKFTHGRLVFPE